MKLHEGDCLDVLPTLESGAADMILADLPYGTTNCKWDSPIDLQRASAFKVVQTILMPTNFQPSTPHYGFTNGDYQ